MGQAAEVARAWGGRVAAELGVPVFLYGAADPEGAPFPTFAGRPSGSARRTSGRRSRIRPPGPWRSEPGRSSWRSIASWRRQWRARGRSGHRSGGRPGGAGAGRGPAGGAGPGLRPGIQGPGSGVDEPDRPHRHRGRGGLRRRCGRRRRSEGATSRRWSWSGSSPPPNLSGAAGSSSPGAGCLRIGRSKPGCWPQQAATSTASANRRPLRSAWHRHLRSLPSCRHLGRGCAQRVSITTAQVRSLRVPPQADGACSG